MNEIKQNNLDRFRRARRAANEREEMVNRYRDFLNYIASNNPCIDSINQQELTPDIEQEPKDENIHGGIRP